MPIILSKDNSSCGFFIMSGILKITLFKMWQFPSIQKTSDEQTTSFKVWWRIVFLISGKTYKSYFPELNVNNGDCSLTVERVTVARKTRVRLPPFALLCNWKIALKGGRYSLQNVNFEVPENFMFSEPPFALSIEVLR